MPVYDSRGRTPDNYEYSGPAQGGAWANAAPAPNSDEASVRRRLMLAAAERAEMDNLLADQQWRAGNQQMTSKWEAERAADIHPYDNMPMERMALDRNSPLYQNSGSSPIQMSIGGMAQESSPGVWQGSAPPDLPMGPHEAMQKVPRDQSQWDAAFSKTNMGRWNQQELSDTPERRAKSDALSAIQSEIRVLMSPEGALVPNRNQRLSDLQKRQDELTGMGAAAPAPNPAPTGTGGLAGAASAASGADGGIEERIQATMAKFGKSREEVVEALRSKGMM